jgi:hypothetical protein
MEYEYDTKALLCSGVTFSAPGDRESDAVNRLIASLKRATEENLQAIAEYRGQEEKEDQHIAELLRLFNTSLIRAAEDNLIKAGFDPTQPRASRGSPDGGEWTNGGGAGNSGGNRTPVPTRRPGGLGGYKPINDPPIRPVYPVETALAVISGGEALAVARTVAMRAAGSTIAEAVEANIAGAARESAVKIARAAQSIEAWLGGPGKFIRNPSGDTVIMRGDKKVRFDINNTSGDEPHFQLEKWISSGRRGKWRDATRQHRYYFKKGE